MIAQQGTQLTRRARPASVGVAAAAPRAVLPLPLLHRRCIPEPVRSGADGEQQQTSTAEPPAAPEPPVAKPAGGQRRKAETTDAVATFLTRRFGIAGGLAWLGFLAVGTLGEQVKTRMEVAAEKEGTRDVTTQQEVTLPSGVKYVDSRIGGGAAPSKGMLVLLNYTAKADGVEFEDTRARGKPIVYIYGGRPFTGGLCAGVEEALATMRAGGRRRVTIPAALGFGDRGAVLRPTEHVPEKQGIIPPGATLEYDLELIRVSIPPS